MRFTYSIEAYPGEKPYVMLTVPHPMWNEQGNIEEDDLPTLYSIFAEFKNEVLPTYRPDAAERIKEIRRQIKTKLNRNISANQGTPPDITHKITMEEQNKMIQPCPRCGFMNHEGSVKCGHCHYAFVESEMVKTPEKSPSGPSGWEIPKENGVSVFGIPTGSTGYNRWPLGFMGIDPIDKSKRTLGFTGPVEKHSYIDFIDKSKVYDLYTHHQMSQMMNACRMWTKKIGIMPPTPLPMFRIKKHEDGRTEFMEMNVDEVNRSMPAPWDWEMFASKRKIFFCKILDFCRKISTFGRSKF